MEGILQALYRFIDVILPFEWLSPVLKSIVTFDRDLKVQVAPAASGVA